MSEKKRKPIVNPKNIIALVIDFLAVIVTLWITRYVLVCKPPSGLDVITQTIIPLVATWMGAIIPYYFAKDNFNAAADRYENVIDKLSPEDKMSEIKAPSVMSPFSEMKIFHLAKILDKVILLDILSLKALKGLNRFILMKGKKCRHVIHPSILGQFINNKILEEITMYVKTLTIRHIIAKKDDSLQSYIHRGMVFLKRNAICLI
jgi:hypothetical protein